MNKLLLILMTICSSASASETQLKACPNKPNCVSSMASGSHRVEPFKLKQGQAISPQQLSDIVQQLEQRTSLSINKHQLHADISSRLFGFIDELDLIIDPEQGIIHVRSAARTGYYDFGVNRRRVEKLRTSLQQAGFIL